MSIGRAFIAQLHEWVDGFYRLGFIEGGLDAVIAHPDDITIRWVDGVPKGCYFADPFILAVDAESVTLLVEEYRFSKTRGRLSKVVVDRATNSIRNVSPILELPTHLSFPYIIEHEGKTLVCPESNNLGEVALYDFDGERLTNPQRIIEGKMLDTQICQMNGRYYAFTVMHTDEGMSETKTLRVYRSDSLTGPYDLLHTIRNDRREERGAGSIFEHDGHLVRPAQICEGGYGQGIVLYELTLDGEKVRETELLRLYPNKKEKNGLGLHTFGAKDGLVVVDGFDYHHRLLGHLAPALYSVKSLINRIVKR